MNLKNLNNYCLKISKIRPNWHKDTLKYYLITQMEQMIPPESRNLYIYDEENNVFRVDGGKIDYQI